VHGSFCGHSSAGRKPGRWLEDSAAWCHMSKTNTNMLNYVGFSKPKFVKVGNGESMSVGGKGDIAFHNDVHSRFILKNVWFVPGIAENLFSVSSAVKMGAQVSFAEKKAIVKKNGRILCTAALHGGLFELNLRFYAHLLQFEGRLDGKLECMPRVWNILS
ncbi:MAG: hypothetical protein AAGA01_17820, partial [Cyanobacteria bacterium P01_E01_bin.43]